MLKMEDGGVITAAPVVQHQDAPAQQQPEVVHAQAGDQPVDVARRYGVPEPALRQANPGMGAQLAAGQRIFLPVLALTPPAEPEPEVHTVEPGESLTQIAEQHKVRLKGLIDANKGLADPNKLQPGQHLLIPKADAAPATPAEATDRALADAKRAQQTLDEVSQSTHGAGAALPYLHQQAQDAQARLKVAMQAEIDATIMGRGGNVADPWDVAQVADDIAARHAASAESETILRTTVKDIRSDAEVSSILKSARGEQDPAGALRKINADFTNASPDVRRKLLNDPQVQGWVKQSADAATAPLKDLGNTHYWPPQVPATKAAHALDETTKGLDPELGAAVVAQTLPAWEEAKKRFEKGGLHLVDSQGRQPMVDIANRVSVASSGDGLVRRMIALTGDDARALFKDTASGGGTAYAIELAREAAAQGRPSGPLMEDTLAGVDSFRHTIDQHTADYAKHFEELGWLVKNHGGTMTPEQLDRAIKDYVDGKPQAWRDEADRLKQQLVDDGEKLLNQMRDLHNLPPELQGHRAEVDALYGKITEDPSARMAIRLALEQRPELTGETQSKKLFDVFTNAKLGDQGRKFAMELGTAYVKHQVLPQLEHLDPNNPASVQRAKDAIDKLENPRFAAAYGLKPEDMKKAVGLLKQSMPQPGETREAAAARVQKLDAKLDEMRSAGGVKAFDKSTKIGQSLRIVGFGLSAVGLMKSINAQRDDPSLKNELRVLVDSAGLTQKMSELALADGMVTEESWVGKFGSAPMVGRYGAAELIGGLGAVLDAWNAYEDFKEDDTTGGLLWSTSAIGGAVATFGAGSIAGPIGIGLVVVATVGIAMHNQAEVANAHDNDDAARFLEHADGGLDKATAKALVDQSFEGHSPVPVLYAYAQQKGLTREQTAQWLNGLQASGQLDDVKRQVHPMADSVDGHPNRIASGSKEDLTFYQDRYAPSSGPRPAPPPEQAPQSYAQLDSWLRFHGIPVPQA